MSRIIATGVLAGAALLCWSCAPQPPREAVASTYKLRRLPPEPKEMIAALFAISQTPLAADPSCAGVGTEPDDVTIGQYLSGFLAELADAEARNAVTASAGQDKLDSGEAVWVCRVMIRHARGEDVWSWGVEYSVRAASGEVIPGSIRCVGAG